MWKPNAQAPVVPVRARSDVLRHRRRHHLQLRRRSSAPTCRTPRSATSPTCSVYPCLVGGPAPADPPAQPGPRPGQRHRLAHRRDRRRHRSQWVFLMSPVAHDSTSTLIQKLVGMAYPFMDLILLTVVVRLAIGAGKRAPSMYLMGAAALALFLTDTVYTLHLRHRRRVRPVRVPRSGMGHLLHPVGSGRPAPLDAEPLGQGTRRRTRDVQASAAVARWRVADRTGRHVDPARPGGRRGHARPHRGVGHVVHPGRRSGCRDSSGVRNSPRSARRPCATPVPRSSRRRTGRASTRPRCRRRARSWAKTAACGCWSRPTTTRIVFQVVAAAGGAEGVEGTRVSLSILPQWKRDRLQSHRSYEVPTEEAELANSLGVPANATFFLNAPLFMKEELQGLLVVAGPSSVPRAIRDSIEALSSQVALALDSAADDRDPADPPERGALLLAGPELLRRGHGRRGRLHDPVHEPVGRARARPRAGRARGHEAHGPDPPRRPSRRAAVPHLGRTRGRRRIRASPSSGCSTATTSGCTSRPCGRTCCTTRT